MHRLAVMLFLQLPATTADSEVAVVPVSNATALAIERALLSLDRESRCSDLRVALESDDNVAGWALRVAEVRLGRTINRVEEAAKWLGKNLISELARSLKADSTANAVSTADQEVHWRLPRLVVALHAAEQRIAEFDRRLEHEKLESLKELAYGASHEINNPLANIAARAQTLLEDEVDPERQRKLAAIHRQAMRAHEMIADLMLYARPPKLVLQPCNLNELVSRVVTEWHDYAQESGIALECSANEEAIVATADATQLAVAIGALIRNACEAVTDGGNVVVRIQRFFLEGSKQAEIAVSDDGPGVSEDVRRHMFDPFFSGREAGRGLGFGLSKCWRIVSEHGGKVLVENRDRGVEMVIRLPVTNQG